MSIISISIVASIISLVYGAFLASSVLKKPAGDKKMQEIQQAIEQGARAYLKRHCGSDGGSAICPGCADWPSTARCHSPMRRKKATLTYSSSPPPNASGQPDSSLILS